MKVKVCTLGAALLLFASQVVWAQQDLTKLLARAGSPFAPEQVLKYQNQLGLSEEQKKSIGEVAFDTQQGLDELRRMHQEEAKYLENLINQDRIDENQVLKSLDKLLIFEREIKRLEFLQLAKIKNILKPEQQKRLLEFRHTRQLRTW